MHKWCKHVSEPTVYLSECWSFQNNVWQTFSKQSTNVHQTVFSKKFVRRRQVAQRFFKSLFLTSITRAIATDGRVHLNRIILILDELHQSQLNYVCLNLFYLLIYLLHNNYYFISANCICTYFIIFVFVSHSVVEEVATSKTQRGTEHFAVSFGIIFTVVAAAVVARTWLVKFFIIIFVIIIIITFLVCESRRDKIRCPTRHIYQ